MTNKRESKNHKFTQPKKSKAGLYSIVGIVAVLVIVGSYFVFGNSNKSNASVNAGC